MSNEVILYTDAREPKTYQAAVAAAVPVTAVKALHSADWAIITEGVALGIERKTTSDFLGSLKSGRLEKQFQKMTDDYQIKVLMLEGPWKLSPKGQIVYKNRNLGWHVASFQMAVYALTRRYNVTPIWVPDINGVAWTVKAFWRRALTKGLVKDITSSEGGTIDGTELWQPDPLSLVDLEGTDTDDRDDTTTDLSDNHGTPDAPSNLRSVRPSRTYNRRPRRVAVRPSTGDVQRGNLGWAEAVRQLTEHP